jgi:mono/diheme cytochrome c family protein
VQTLRAHAQRGKRPVSGPFRHPAPARPRGRPAAPRTLCTLACAHALLVGALLAGCHMAVVSDPAQVTQGRALFAQLCARCHGAQAVGQDPLHPFGSADRKVGFVAPALNGRGHASLHAPRELFALIKDGGSIPGSPMPAWGAQLSDAQITAVIAYLYGLWPPGIRRPYEAQHRDALRALLGRPG